MQIVLVNIKLRHMFAFMNLKLGRAELMHIPSEMVIACANEHVRKAGLKFAEVLSKFIQVLIMRRFIDIVSHYLKLIKCFQKLCLNHFNISPRIFTSGQVHASADADKI